jgi:hypothetical protein
MFIDACCSITVCKEKSETNSEWNCMLLSGEKQIQHDSLVSRINIVLAEKSLPRMRGRAKLGETKKLNIHEKLWVLIFR